MGEGVTRFARGVKLCTKLFQMCALKMFAFYLSRDGLSYERLKNLAFNHKSL